MLINHFDIDGSWYIVDLPGYGYARRGKEGRENIRRIIERYILGRESMTCLFVLIDSRHEPQKIDLEFMAWLGRKRCAVCPGLHQADKLGTTVLRDKVEAYKTRLLEEWGRAASPVHHLVGDPKRSRRAARLHRFHQRNAKKLSLGHRCADGRK